MNDKTLVERLREQHEQKSAALRNLYGLPVIVTESDTQKGKSALWMDNGMAGCGQVAISTGEFPCKQTDAIGALVNIAAATDYASVATRIEALEAALNKPEIHDWAKGVAFEAAHQRERWGVEHDASKTPFDWFWLIGYLAQKAADAAVRGDTEKAMHHTISTGAALANWHLALSGVDNSMRPGIVPPKALEGSGND